MTAYIGVKDGDWRWTGQAASLFASSPGVERRFCSTCGTPLSFRSEKMSATMHFYVAAMEDLNMFEPTMHVAHEEKLDWLQLSDGLPAVLGPDYTKG